MWASVFSTAADASCCVLGQGNQTPRCRQGLLALALPLSPAPALSRHNPWELHVKNDVHFPGKI